ncbi:P-loop containing nucleoside triphosphate hydrolase protein [Mycena polygramma]|nr:P-loop containing nucleoside triphosphate hydrolase protein [Mycena polygramma]
MHIESDTRTELPPSVLNHIGKFTATLHKVNTFIEAQQNGSKIKKLFRQGDLGTLLKNCREGLQQGLDSFQIKMGQTIKEITDIQKMSQNTHEEVLHLIEALSDDRSDGVSTISRVYSGAYNSSTSISMLPSEPKIFHGRDSELNKILQLFSQGVPRIAILGAGGMGKTTVAKVVLHHTQTTTSYGQCRYFVPCDAAKTRVELAALIGAHLGLKPTKDLTHAVVQFFSSSPPGLLILDNLETVWEPIESRKGVEEFLSLLTDVGHLALMVTMRGAERPAKVAWTHPFLQPLSPLGQDAAYQTFVDTADDVHNPEDIGKVLALTDNMPLAISLLAHLVDSEGCSTVLSRWEEERTSMIFDGWDRRSNLDLSISMSLSSPRLVVFPHSRELLSLLSMLPNGLSDTELVQSKLEIDDILGCKAVLVGTSLAYTDSKKRLKALVPIREYMQKIQPPKYDLIKPLRRYFQELLELYREYYGTASSSGTVVRISSNLANIQNVLQEGLYRGHPDLVDCIYCTCYLSQFSRLTAQGEIHLMKQIPNVLPLPCDHRLEAYFATELLDSRYQHNIENVESVIPEALPHIEQCNDSDLKCKLISIPVC